MSWECVNINIMSYDFNVKCQKSNVRCQKSIVKCQMSNVKSQMSKINCQVYPAYGSSKLCELIWHTAWQLLLPCFTFSQNILYSQNSLVFLTGSESVCFILPLEPEMRKVREHQCETEKKTERQGLYVNHYNEEFSRNIQQCPARVGIGSESEKWNENVSRSRSRVKSEMKMPQNQDREVKLKKILRILKKRDSCIDIPTSG